MASLLAIYGDRELCKKDALMIPDVTKHSEACLTAKFKKNSLAL